MEATNQAKPKRKKILIPVLIIAGLGIFFIAKNIISSWNTEDTENSQLEANISPVVPKIGGYITQIRVKENQQVKKGDTLVTIDDRDLKIKVEQAEIALENAIANVEALKANVSTAGASLRSYNLNAATADASMEAAKVRVWKATEDYNRYLALLNQKSITQAQFDAVKAEKETAEKMLVVAQKQLAAGESQTGVGSSQVNASEKQVALANLQVEQRKTELEYAKLQLSYATITAPCNGIVSKKNIQPGQLVNAGTQLFAIVDDSDVWVTANFKETQIEKMKVGQKVKIETDAYPDVSFEGTIESLAAATGSRFTLLPPDNASGNFVKVVQRVPVRITIDKTSHPEHPLRAGLNVKVIVSLN